MDLTTIFFVCLIGGIIWAVVSASQTPANLLCPRCQATVSSKATACWNCKGVFTEMPEVKRKH